MFAKQTEYAIRGLVYIFLQNKKGKRPGYKEIAKGINSPEHYMAKILQNLTRHELINSIKGRGGGFFFSSPQLILPLFTVIKITEGEKFFTKCGFGLQSCDANNPCPLHDDYMPIREEFHTLVNKVSIQSLAQKIMEEHAVLNRLI